MWEGPVLVWWVIWCGVCNAGLSRVALGFVGICCVWRVGLLVLGFFGLGRVNFGFSGWVWCVSWLWVLVMWV